MPTPTLHHDMPPLPDDLKQEEESSGAHDSLSDVSPKEQAAFDQIAAGARDPASSAPEPAYKGSLPEFDPNKRVAAEAKKKKAAQDKGSGDAKPEKENNFGYQPGGSALRSALQGAGVAGGALALAQLVGAFGNRNKGKLLAGGGVAGMILALGLFASSLGLVHAKNNAEKSLDSITSQVLSGRRGKLIQRAIAKKLNTREGLGDMFKEYRLDKNVDELAGQLDEAGYTFSDGKLTTPDGNVLSSADEIEGELANFASENNINNNRNAVSKELTDRLNIAKEAAVEGEPSSKDEEAAKKSADEDNPSATEEEKAAAADEDAARNKAVGDSREQAIKGDGGEVTSPQVKEAESELKDAAGGDGDAAKSEADDLIDDPAKEASESVVDIAAAESDDAANDVAKSIAENAEKEGLSAGKLLNGAGQLAQVVCTWIKRATAAITFGIIAKRYNLIKVFGVFVNNADAILSGNANGKVLGEFMKAIGPGWMNGGGMRSLNTGTNIGASSRTLSLLQTNRQGTSGVLGALVALGSITAVSTLCRYAVDSRVQIGIAVVDLGVKAITSFFTGGAAGAAEAGAETAAEEAVTNGIGLAIAKALAIGIGVAGATTIGELYIKNTVSKLFSSALVTFSKGEAGPFMGEAFAAGAGSYFETKGRGEGMGPQTRDVYIQNMNKVRVAQRKELAKQSLFERFAQVDYQHSESLLSQMVAESPIAAPSAGGIAQNLVASLTHMDVLSGAQKFASVALSGSTYAQDGDVNVDSNGYVVDAFGNFIVGNNLDNIDPVDNYNALLASNEVDTSGKPVDGSGLQKYIDDCTDVVIFNEGGDNSVKSDCTGASAKKYQAYLADRDNVAGIDAHYNPNSPAGSDTGSTDTQTGTVPSGDVKQLAQQIIDLHNQGKISYAVDTAALDANFKRLAQGQPALTLNNHPVNPDPRILQAIIYLAGQGTVQLNSYIDGQSHTKPGNPHYEGKAIDIGAFNGVTIGGGRGNSAKTSEVMNILSQVLPAGSRFGSSSFGSGSVTLNGKAYKTFNDTPNHLHVDVVGVP